MNREIKFRGKRVDNDEWVYGNLQQQAVKNEEYYITSITAPFNEFLNNSHVIDPKTVGQYTGLKDKNFKEIYEGDIVANCSASYIVMFDPQGYWCLDGNGALNSEMLSSELSLLEVIGNIHENEVINANTTN